MNPNFKSLLQYDEQLCKCFSIATDRKVLQSVNKDEINSVAVAELCVKIDEMLVAEMKTERCHLAWVLSGQLLIGTSLCHQFQVQCCYEDSSYLMRMCEKKFFVIKQTETIKRKTEEIFTKSKRQRTIIEEITKSNNIGFWETSDEFDDDPKRPSVDVCGVPNEQITLREPDYDDATEPTHADEEDDFNDFNDSNLLNISEISINQSEAESVHSFSLPALEGQTSTPSRKKNYANSSIGNESEYTNELDFVESVADGSQTNAENTNISIEHSNESHNDEPVEHHPMSEAETMENVLADVTNMTDLESEHWRRSTKKNQSLITYEDKILGSEFMAKRLSKISIGCKRRKSTVVATEKLRFKEATILSVPVTFGLCSNNLFNRNTKLLSANENDTSIIRDILKMGNQCEPQTIGSVIQPDDVDANQVLRGDVAKVRGTQRLLQKSPPNDTLPPSPKLIEWEWNMQDNENEANVITPPIEFQNNNDSQQINLQIQSQQIESDTESEDDPNWLQLISQLDECSLELVTLKRLSSLWRKNVYPIGMGELNKPNYNRVRAAKTFAAILALHKKKFIRIECKEIGTIYHLCKGDTLLGIV